MLAEGAVDGLVAHERGRILLANEAFGILYDLAPESLRGRDLLDLIAPESRALAERHLLDRGESTFLVTGVRADGTRMDLELASRAVPTAGDLARVVTVRELAARAATAEGPARGIGLYEGILTALGKAGNGVVVVEDRRVIYANGTASDLVGRSRGDLASLASVLELLGPSLRERTSTSPFPSSGTVPLALPDGSKRELAYSAVRLSERDPMRVAVLFRNVTADEHLAHDRAHFAALVAASSEAIVGLDGEGRIVSWNQAAETLLQHPAAEVIGKSIAMVVPRARLGVEHRVFERLARGEGPIVLDLPLERRDLSSFPARTTWSTLGAADDLTRGFSLTIRDLTEERQFTDVLRRAHAANELVLGAVSEGILSLDAQGRILSANHAAARLLGFPENALLGRAFHELAQARDGEGNWRTWDASPIRHSLKTGQPLHVDRDVFLTADARPLPVSYSVTPVEGRTSVAGVLVFADASERIHAEEAASLGRKREEEIERLRALAAMRARFINLAAHHLATPLTPILIQLPLLRAMELRSPRERRALDVVERNAKRLKGHVDALLLAARLEGHDVVLSRTVVDLASVLARPARTARAAAEEAGIELDVEVESEVLVDVDAARIEDVLDRLLDNAVRFTPRGGKVSLRAGREDASARITVRDSGEGFDAKDLSLLFEAYSRWDVGERTTSGAGLGLFIARGIVELHGGTITAESEGPGRGALFVVTLPAAEGPASSA